MKKKTNLRRKILLVALTMALALQGGYKPLLAIAPRVVIQKKVIEWQKEK